MSFLDHLPVAVAQLIKSRFVCEFATVTQAGVPIDSPLVPFLSEDLETIDSATGLAYPAKAERLRRNPRIGMLFEGGPNEPVVSISAFGAVRDTDFQSNLDRYLSEEILTPTIDPARVDYQSLTREAIWYFTRIIMTAKPAVVRWWDSPAAMAEPPQEWRAPAGTVYPQSDPAPAGKPSPSPWSPHPSWFEVAERALQRGAGAHLTVLDAEGFPLPIRALAAALQQDGLILAMPGWLPWREGKATLSFEGIETLVGDVEVVGGEAHFRPERALPMHPLITDPAQILCPTQETRTALLCRIDHELSRRGITARPQMPARPPEPTRGATMRAESAYGFMIAGSK